MRPDPASGGHRVGVARGMGGFGADHADLPVMRQRAGDVGRQTAPQPRPARVVGQVFERQHGDGGPVVGRRLSPGHGHGGDHQKGAERDNARDKRNGAAPWRPWPAPWRWRVRRQHVALPGHGAHQPVIVVRQPAPDVAHALHEAILGHRHVAPDRVHQGLFRDHLAAPRGEHAQHVGRFGTQQGFGAVRVSQRAGRQVGLCRPKAQDHGRAIGGI
jgi:hypothetical protein